MRDAGQHMKPGVRHRLSQPVSRLERHQGIESAMYQQGFLADFGNVWPQVGSREEIETGIQDGYRRYLM